MLARYGLVCPSFVAPPPLEELRRLTRLHARTRRVASTLRNMLHRMLDESGLRIGGILTDLFGLSGRNLLDGLLAGQDPEQLVAGVKGNPVCESYFDDDDIEVRVTVPYEAIADFKLNEPAEQKRDAYLNPHTAGESRCGRSLSRSRRPSFWHSRERLVGAGGGQRLQTAACVPKAMPAG